jgi:WD40 repeat protein
MPYNAFMSYSHAADGRLAPELQQALHGFAKPWYRLRAMHVFRDATNLHVTPKLWPAIQTALDQSTFFILLASPDAAASEWVDREVEYWLRTKTADRILIVVTAGDLEWDDAARRFDVNRSSALPPRLLAAFSEEPLYLDLRWARGRDDLSIHQPKFRDAVADLAATIHGRDKDELVGEDVRQHRRAQRLAASAIAALSVLTAIAIVVAIFAVGQRNAAREQRAAAVEQSRIALARQLAAQSTTILTQFPEKLPLAALLALESTRLHESFETRQALRGAASLLPLAVSSYAIDHPYSPLDRVRAMAFSRDGRYLAAARDDGTATLADVAHGKVSAILSHGDVPHGTLDGAGDRVEWKAGEDDEFTCVDISPDGRLVATGSKDNTARLWDVASGREISALRHGGAVNSVAFHPSGASLATGSQDGEVALFDVATGRKAYARHESSKVRTTTIRLGSDGKPTTEAGESTETAAIVGVAFSPDGRSLGVLRDDGAVSVLDAKTGERRKTWYGGTGGLALTFSRNSKYLAASNGDFASVRDVDTAKEVFKTTHAESAEGGEPAFTWIDDVAFSPDGNYLATAGRDGTARIWDLRTGRERIRLKHPTPVRSVVFGNDGATLATGSITGARLWDVISGRERWRLVGGNEIVSVSPDGRLIAAAGNDGAISVLSSSRAGERAQMLHAHPIRAVSISADGSKVATADDSGGVRLWSADGAPIASRSSPLYGPRGLAFSDGGRFLAASGRDPALSVMDTASGLSATTLAKPGDLDAVLSSPRFIVAIERRSDRLRAWDTTGHERPPIESDSVDAIRFDPSGTLVAFRELHERDRPSVIRVWDLERGRELGRRDVEGRGRFAVSPRGQFVAVNIREKKNEGPPDYYADVWELATGKRIAHIRQDDDDALVVFDPAGKRLLTAGSNSGEQHEIRVWDLSTDTLASRLMHQDQIDGLKFAAEQNVIATLSAGIVYLWDASTGDLLTQVADASPIRAFDVSRSGQLLTGADDGVAAMWLWKTDDLRAEACKRLTRNLSTAEWQQYVGAAPYDRSCPNLPGSDEPNERR